MHPRVVLLAGIIPLLLLVDCGRRHRCNNDMSEQTLIESGLAYNNATQHVFVNQLGERDTLEVTDESYYEGPETSKVQDLFEECEAGMSRELSTRSGLQAVDVRMFRYTFRDNEDEVRESMEGHANFFVEGFLGQTDSTAASWDHGSLTFTDVLWVGEQFGDASPVIYYVQGEQEPWSHPILVEFSEVVAGDTLVWRLESMD